MVLRLLSTPENACEAPASRRNGDRERAGSRERCRSTGCSPEERRSSQLGRREPVGGAIGGGGAQDLRGRNGRRRRLTTTWLDSVDEGGSAELLGTPVELREAQNSGEERRLRG
jgi:hypothetical protein